jgi:tRNA 5-methylaminomethyl-2-thiouridine biosynthesis bifunctional protein
MPRLPPLPQLDWKDNAPHSRDKDDVYFSGEGLSEKRTVFLSGCDLPEAWTRREHFTVGELGFGTGLNFLALMDLWRRHRPSPSARLDFLSFEGFLLSASDASRIHAQWPELADLSSDLIARWPVRARGAQRIRFADGVTLTLFIDEISASLPQARAYVDAWFLDGFAPSKNPEMWSTETMGHVARLSAPGARAASYSVASDVRRNLEAAGFAVEKKPGFGRKKERLEARLVLRTTTAHPGESRDERVWGQCVQPPSSVLIIGAGIAGACAASAFLARGSAVTVLDKTPAPGSAASGNPIALVMPRLDAADSPAARALIEAYLYAQRFYAVLGPEAAIPLDAIHRPRGDREQQRFAKLLADPPIDDALLQPLDASDSSAGLRHRDAIAVRPSTAFPTLLDGAILRFNAHVASIRENRVRLASGETLEADLIIASAGMGLAEIEGFAPPPLTGRLGQIESASTSATPNAIADGGYAVEAFGQLVFGATFEPAEGEPQITEAARAENIETLARLRPDLKPQALTSRAAIRATTPDRFPFAGPPPNEKAPDADPAPFSSLRLIGGLGARGFLWAPLLAELLASEAFGEPSPVETSIAETLDPGRFVRRARLRGS